MAMYPLEPNNGWTYIYGLIDPETEEIRYVGKSIRPTQRLQNHMNEVSNCHRSHWLQSLKRRGLKPELMILESVHGEWPWQESERYWIKRLKDAGCRLTNNTSGGDGVSDLPPETREKMRQTWLGRKHRPETLIKLSIASAGRRHSTESKERMRRLMTGRKIEWVDKVAKGLRKFSSEAVSVIRIRLDAGEKVGALAVEYNTHRTTISKIKKGTYFERYRKSNT